MAGLRERKKQATHDGIVVAALGLFGEHGYAETSVSRIADAAGISPATFFVYFPTKEDVVFADQGRRVEQVEEVLRGRREDESVASVVRRALVRVLDSGPAGVADDEMSALRGRVVAGTPELRSAAAGRMFACEQRWAEVLLDGDPELDPLIVHAMLGAALGAAVATALSAIDGHLRPLDRIARALDVALPPSGATG